MQSFQQAMGNQSYFICFPSYSITLINAKHGNVKNTSIVLVISPLNALIEDQMSILERHGIEAAVLNTVTKHNVVHEDEESNISSDSDSEERRKVRILSLDATTGRKIKEGRFQFIFAHPEAFIS